MDALTLVFMGLWLVTLAVAATMTGTTVRLRSELADVQADYTEWYNYAVQWWRYARGLEQTVHNNERRRTSVTPLDKYRQNLRTEHGLTAKEPNT